MIPNMKRLKHRKMNSVEMPYVGKKVGKAVKRNRVKRKKRNIIIEKDKKYSSISSSVNP